MTPVRVDEQHRPDRAELADLARAGAALDEAPDEVVEPVGLADVHGDVIEPPTATDHVVGQTRRVTGHLEQQQADVVPDGVRHRCEATERHAVRVVDHHGSEAEHVLVEAAEAVEVGGDECGVAEPGSVVAGCVHAVMVASRTSARHRWKHATSAPCAGQRRLPPGARRPRHLESDGWR